MEATGVTHAIVRGMLARDVEMMRAALAPDVVLRSPVTAVPFEGREAVAELLGLIAERYERYELLGDWREGSTYVFHARMWIGGGEVELLERLELDDEDRVREQIIFGRPLAGSALFAAEIGPLLAERAGGRRRRVLAAALTRPLPGLLRAGDRLVARFTRPR